jgi:hypothetical protein
MAIMIAQLNGVVQPLQRSQHLPDPTDQTAA